MVDLHGAVQVFDIWQVRHATRHATRSLLLTTVLRSCIPLNPRHCYTWQERSLGSFTGSYTAKQVPMHGTAFLRLSKA